MSQVKISRKKLLQEPDEFLSLSQQVWLWVHQNRDRALMIAAGTVAAVLLAVGVKAYSENSRGRRATAVAAAVARYTQATGGVIPADLQRDLAGLADRYDGTPQGAIARFFQAGALAAAGEGEKARQIYTALSANGAKNGDLAVLARGALAYLDLGRGALDAALPAFQDLLKIQGVAVPRAQIMMEIAAIHEKQGRIAEARRVYQELVSEYPDGSWVTTAKERLNLLPRGSAAS